LIAMNRLLDLLKQVLRSTGRGRDDQHPAPAADRTAKDGGDPGTRLRTELDGAPSALARRLAPAATPNVTVSRGTRPAILSKGRRTAVAAKPVTSFWAMAPLPLADASGDPAPLAAAPVLSGASVLQAAPTVADEWRDLPSGLSGGATTHDATQAVTGPRLVLEPAPKLSPDEDRSDRLFRS
jgi:hypothetical protein